MHGRPARSGTDHHRRHDGEEEALLAEEHLSLSAFAGAEGLNAKVLVLNKAFMAIRVVTARRAFGLLFRNIAEIIHVETDGAGAQQFLTYNIETWTDAAEIQRRLERERERYDWVRTVRLEIPVPRIIRLLGYDRLPDQAVKLNRRPEQAGLTLIRKPERPRRNPLITLRLGHEKYASWKAFLDHAYWSVELK